MYSRARLWDISPSPVPSACKLKAKDNCASILPPRRDARGPNAPATLSLLHNVLNEGNLIHFIPTALR